MVRITPMVLVFSMSPVAANDCQVDGYGSATFAGDVDGDSLYRPVTMWGKRMGTLEMCKELCECTRNCGCFRYDLKTDNVNNGGCWLYESDKCTASDAERTCGEIMAGNYRTPAFLRDAGNVPDDDPDAGVFRRGSRGDTSVPSAAQCVVKKFRTADHFHNAYKLLGNFDETADDYSLMSCGYYYGYWVGGKYDGKWENDGYKEDVATAEECAAHCDQTHGCAGFVWFDENAYSGWAHRCVPYTEAHWCDQGIYTDTTRSGHRGWSYWRAAGPSTAPMPGGESGHDDASRWPSGGGADDASVDGDDASVDADDASSNGTDASNAAQGASSLFLQSGILLFSGLVLITS